MPRMTPAEYNAFIMRTARQHNAQLTGEVQLGREYATASIDPVSNERKLHEQIQAECSTRGWICLTGSMAKPTHRTMGEPDFVILASEGRTMLVECKSRTGKLSLAQRALAYQAHTLGHTVHVVRSLGEFLEVIR